LDLALDATPAGQNVMLIEADVVTDPELITRVVMAAYRGGAAATLLSPYEPCLSGTFATVKNDLVSAWVHESVRPPDFKLGESFKTVNVSFFHKGQARDWLATAVKETIDKKGPKAPLEYAMHDLVQKGMRIAPVFTGEAKWFEVDTPEDLEIANGLFEDSYA
jgi:NDP-sugar pyrophosphorylase family protein